MTKNALALFIFVACAASMARAQRQVIDAHAHVTLSEAAVRRAVQIMDENGIVKMVDLSGGFGEQLKSKIELYNKIAPGRFAVFTNMDFSKVNDPQFSKKAMADLEEAYRLGARGLKSFKSLGLVHKDQTGHLIRFDDPRFDPVWTKCGELGIPVWFHVGDPAAFFRPPTADNERYAELSVHPEWSFYGGQFPAREELLTQMVNVVLRHPETTFVGVHFGNNPENYRHVAAVLDRCPNFNIDTAARVGEIGRRDPATLREFFIKYQDRILFGSDTVFSPENMDLGVPVPEKRTNADAREFFERHWKFFETAGRNLEHPSPIQGNWKVNGINLPPQVLRKLYTDNARRLIPGLSTEDTPQRSRKQ
ncbi:MAG: amidohydrolase [Acidobacteria bacterium]|nr:MAG: amidohydrolase [Acidobacteriota bacterium]